MVVVGQFSRTTGFHQFDRGADGRSPFCIFQSWRHDVVGMGRPASRAGPVARGPSTSGAVAHRARRRLARRRFLNERPRPLAMLPFGT